MAGKAIGQGFNEVQWGAAAPGPKMMFDLKRKNLHVLIPCFRLINFAREVSLGRTRPCRTPIVWHFESATLVKEDPVGKHALVCAYADSNV